MDNTVAESIQAITLAIIFILNTAGLIAAAAAIAIDPTLFLFSAMSVPAIMLIGVTGFLLAGLADLVADLHKVKLF
jgi:hypothetical protein